MSRIRSMTLRTRLLVLGGGGVLAVVVLAAVSLLQLSSIKTSTHRNASAAQQATLVGNAYESWISTTTRTTCTRPWLRCTIPQRRG